MQNLDLFVVCYLITVFYVNFPSIFHRLIGIAKANSKTVVLHNRVVDHYNQTATMDNATKMIEEIEKQSVWFDLIVGFLSKIRFK